MVAVTSPRNRTSMREWRCARVVRTKTNEQRRRADRPFIGTVWKTRGWRVPVAAQTSILHGCPPEPGEVVGTILMSQELGEWRVKSGDAVIQEYLSHHVCCSWRWGSLHPSCKGVGRS